MSKPPVASKRAAPHGTGLVIDIDKLSRMSSRFCPIMYHHRSENVDWDVGHSPGTLSPRQRYASRLGCPKQRSRCHPTSSNWNGGVGRSAPFYIERQRRWQPARPRPPKRDRILIDLALQGGGSHGCFITVCREG